MGKKEQFSSDFAVVQPRAAYGVGAFIIVSAAAVLVLEIRYHVKAIPAWIYLVIAGIFLLGVYVWAEAWNRRLMVVGNVFYYRNVLGRVVSFSLGDIGYGKSAYNPARGRDYLRLYDKEGKLLCRLECGMKNAARLLWYLHDNGVSVELEKGTGGFVRDIMRQQPVTEEEMRKLSWQVYGQLQVLAGKWLERNEGMGAEFEYGFACYFMGKMDENLQIQPEGSRCSLRGKGDKGKPEGERENREEGEKVRERENSGEKENPRERGNSGERENPRERGSSGERETPEERGNRGEGEKVREREDSGEGENAEGRGNSGEREAPGERGNSGEKESSEERGNNGEGESIGENRVEGKNAGERESIGEGAGGQRHVEETLPEDFFCRLELYVKKDGYLVQDRKGQLPMLDVPVFYQRKSEVQGEGLRLYYNGGWLADMEEGLEWLEVYLPKHRFFQSEGQLRYTLEKTL